MKITVIKELRIEIEPIETAISWLVFRKPNEHDMEYRARCMEKWAKDFELFLRDHRSQDPVSLSVVKDRADVCSFCEREWEIDDSGCPVCCDNAVDEYGQNIEQMKAGE